MESYVFVPRPFLVWCWFQVLLLLKTNCGWTWNAGGKLEEGVGKSGVDFLNLSRVIRREVGKEGFLWQNFCIYFRFSYLFYPFVFEVHFVCFWYFFNLFTVRHIVFMPLAAWGFISMFSMDGVCLWFLFTI